MNCRSWPSSADASDTLAAGAPSLSMITPTAVLPSGSGAAPEILLTVKSTFSSLSSMES